MIPGWMEGLIHFWIMYAGQVRTTLPCSHLAKIVSLSVWPTFQVCVLLAKHRQKDWDKKEKTDKHSLRSPFRFWRRNPNWITVEAPTDAATLSMATRQSVMSPAVMHHLSNVKHLQWHHQLGYWRQISSHTDSYTAANVIQCRLRETNMWLWRRRVFPISRRVKTLCSLSPIGNCRGC